MFKQCRTCNEYKDEETDFYSRGMRNGKQRNGFDTECKECAKERTKANSSPEIKRFHMVNFKYNLSKEEYTELLIKFPVCGSCGETFIGTPHVDHCHRTNKVRGLLCSRCNRTLGNADDDISRLKSCIKYLETYGIIESLVAD